MSSVKRIVSKSIKQSPKSLVDSKRLDKIMKNHVDGDKITARVNLVESMDVSDKTFVPFFDVNYLSDVAGWYTKIEMVASKDGTWNEDLVGKPVVTLQYFDGDIVLNLKYKHDSYKIELPIFALHDVAIAAELLNKMSKNRMFTKVKMKKK